MPDRPIRGERYSLPPGKTYVSVSAVSPQMVFLIDSEGMLWAMTVNPSDGERLWAFLDGPPATPPARAQTEQEVKRA